MYNYLTSQGSLMTILIDGSRSPVVEGSVTVGDEVVDVVLDGSTAYCALGTGNGIAIVDLDDRDQPALLGTHTLGGNVTSLARDGDVIYAGVAGVGLVSLDIVGDTLEEVDTLALAAEPAAVFADGERVYLVGPELGLVVVDSSLGSDLIQIGSRALNGSVGVAIAGAIFVGRGTQGFSSLDSSACDSGGSLVTTSYIPASARTRGDAGTFWLTDVAIASHTFPAGLPGAPSPEAFLPDLLAKLAPDGLRIAGVTLGRDGCLAVRDGEAPVRVPGHEVEVADTTGAGDVFHAGFAAALLEGESVEAAARFANAAAALKCRGRTGRAKLPDREEIRALAGLR